MYKATICALFTIVLSTTIQAQDEGNEPQASKEFKLNASNLIAFTFLDASYEALLNEESSLG